MIRITQHAGAHKLLYASLWISVRPACDSSLYSSLSTVLIHLRRFNADDLSAGALISYSYVYTFTIVLKVSGMSSLLHLRILSLENPPCKAF